MTTVIINPLSGPRGRSSDVGRSRADEARRLLDAHHVDARIHISEYPGHANVLARDAVAAGARLVCAWGGDGTLNEVASALVHTSVPLGIVPAGSGNGFARELGVFLKPKQAFAVALKGQERAIDAGVIGGRMFFNIAGIGLDAHIAREFNTRAPHRRGFARYVGIGWRQLITYRPGSYGLDADGERLDRKAFMVVLANARQYGNGAYIAAQATPDDGYLDLVVVGARSTLGALMLTPRLFTRSLHRANGVLTRRVRSVRISSDGPLHCHVDGEAFDAECELLATVRPLALTVRVARTS